jgi:hypothetical protein
MNTELKPCPFCGGAAKEYNRFNASTVTCRECGAMVKQSVVGMGDANYRWNRRAAQPVSAGLTDEQIFDLVAEHEVRAKNLWGGPRFTQSGVMAFSRALLSAAQRDKPAKFEMTLEMKAALAEAAKTGAVFAELPGGKIMFINYGEQPEDDSDLNCPHCGGSGHKDDVGAAQRDSQPDHIGGVNEMVVPNQSHTIVQLFAALRSVNAVAVERGDPGACDQIDNDGQPYQSQWLADLLSADARQPAPDTSADARDAERYRWLRDKASSSEVEGFWWMDDVDEMQRSIDAAIAASKEPTQ